MKFRSLLLRRPAGGRICLPYHAARIRPCGACFRRMNCPPGASRPSRTRPGSAAMSRTTSTSTRATRTAWSISPARSIQRSFFFGKLPVARTGLRIPDQRRRPDPDQQSRGQRQFPGGGHAARPEHAIRREILDRDQVNDLALIKIVPKKKLTLSESGRFRRDSSGAESAGDRTAPWA